MTEQFEQYRIQKKLFTESDRIVLALSGGIDSVVMLHIFSRLSLNIAAAHCNFNLRGDESDADEIFVKELCRKKNVRLYTTKFDTREYAKKKRISIQMAARELRYEWFEKIRDVNEYDLIATGHNLNDSVETVLINLTRGTGISGLTGISPKSGNIIRPLLFATRDMISDYAMINSLDYREDSSNIQTKYTRNKIRHKILPVLKEINPSVLISINETSEFLKGAGEIYSGVVEEKKKEIIRHNKNKIIIPVQKLKDLKPEEIWIYEIFREWNFGRLQVKDIISLTGSASGKQLFSESHCITRDRESLIVTCISEKSKPPSVIMDIDKLAKDPAIKNAELIDREGFKITGDPAYACLDADLIKFPVIIRKWEEGDFFHPFGMKGRKKISDLLIDMKIPVPDKENIYVLVSEEDIVWVIGIRIDNRYRITERTGKVLFLQKAG